MLTVAHPELGVLGHVVVVHGAATPNVGDPQARLKLRTPRRRVRQKTERRAVGRQQGHEPVVGNVHQHKGHLVVRQPGQDALGGPLALPEHCVPLHLHNLLVLLRERTPVAACQCPLGRVVQGTGHLVL